MMICLMFPVLLVISSTPCSDASISVIKCQLCGDSGNTPVEDHGVSASLVRHTDWLLSNMTSSEVLEVIFRSTPSPGGVLALGGTDFVRQVFCGVSSLFSNGVQPIHSIFECLPRHCSEVWTSHWPTPVHVKDYDVLNDVLSPLGNVMTIDLAASQLPMWVLTRSEDAGLKLTTSLCFHTCPLGGSSLQTNQVQRLSGRTLRVVVRQRYVMVQRVIKGGYPDFEGALIDILHEMSIRLNFTYHLIESSEDSWGQELDNGQWDGLIGYLTRQEADLALGNFRVTAGRAAVADYTHPYVFYDAVLAYKTPGTSISHSVDFYLNPLEPEVYAALLGCLLWVLLLLTWSRAWHRYTQGQQTAALELTECLVADAEIVVAAMLNKRHVLLITWVYVSVVVVGYTYSSQLTASLTVQEVSPPFSSLQQLVSQDTYTWGMANGTAIQTLIKVSKNKVYRQFWEGVTRFARTQPRVLSSSEDEQLSQVWAGRYACLLGSDFVLAYWQSLHCHLSGVIVQGLQKPAVFYLQKNSPYTSLVSEALSSMRETGIVSRILQKWTPQRKRCESHNVTSAISLTETRTAFYVLGTGVFVSLLTLAVELFMHAQPVVQRG